MQCSRTRETSTTQSTQTAQSLVLDVSVDERLLGDTLLEDRVVLLFVEELLDRFALLPSNGSDNDDDGGNNEGQKDDRSSDEPFPSAGLIGLSVGDNLTTNLTIRRVFRVDDDVCNAVTQELEVFVGQEMCSFDRTVGSVVIFV